MSLTFLPVDARSLTTLKANLHMEENRHLKVQFPEKLFDSIRSNSIEVPTKLDQLHSEDTFTSVLSVDAALQLGIPVAGSLDTRGARRIMVQEYLKFVDLGEGNQRVRWGVGARLIVNVRTLDGQAKLSSIPAVVASAQVGFVEASARFQVIGLQSEAITAAIPAPTSLNVDSYVLFQAALAKVKELIYKPETRVAPQMLALLGEPTVPSADREYEAALAIGWALKKIEEGKTLQRAMSDYERGSVFFRDMVRSVYVDLCMTSELTQKPGEEARARARRLLNGLSVGE